MTSTDTRTLQISLLDVQEAVELAEDPREAYPRRQYTNE